VGHSDKLQFCHQHPKEQQKADDTLFLFWAYFLSPNSAAVKVFKEKIPALDLAHKEEKPMFERHIDCIQMC